MTVRSFQASKGFDPRSALKVALPSKHTLVLAGQRLCLTPRHEIGLLGADALGEAGDRSGHNAC